MRKIRLDVKRWKHQRWAAFEAAVNWRYVRTVLNIGASRVNFFLRNVLDRHRVEITILEIYDFYVRQLQTDPSLEVMQGDLRTYTFDPNRRWDLVLWWNGAEHLPQRSDLGKALENLEPRASQLIVCGTPWGFRRQPKAVDGNILQRHSSHWNVKDWESHGYSCVCVGPYMHRWNQLMAFKLPEGSSYTSPSPTWWRKVTP